jgi:hypothetical protein
MDAARIPEFSIKDYVDELLDERKSKLERNGYHPRIMRAKDV